MNIFLAFFQSPTQHPIPAYNFWPYYIKNGIEEAGHKWSECPGVDWALGLVPDSPQNISKWRGDAWDKTLDWLKKNPANICLTYLYPHMVDLAAIKEIKRLGIPCINFYCDHLRDFKKAPIEFSEFDLSWVPEYKAVKLYKQAGYPFVNLPMPIWVSPGLRVLREERNKLVTFIGSKDIQRQLFLENVVQQYPDIPLAVYGSRWEGSPSALTETSPDYTWSKKISHQFSFLLKHGLVPYLRKIRHQQYAEPVSEGLKSKICGVPGFEEYNELSSGSMITVGINRYPSFQFPFFQPDTYSRLRDIEAPMLGACYLTEWTEGLDELYIPGEEIETYRNAEEFIEKSKGITGRP